VNKSLVKEFEKEHKGNYPYTNAVKRTNKRPQSAKVNIGGKG